MKINNNKLIPFIFVVFFGYLIYLLVMHRTNPTESFRPNNHLFNKTDNWSDDLLKRFREYQNTSFDNTYQFNMEMLQHQASPQEAEYMLKNNHWAWSNETQQLYLDEIAKNTMVQILPQASLNNVMKIYNENAMRQMLSWNTKEGDFLLSGVTIKNKIENGNGNDHKQYDSKELANSNFSHELTKENESIIRCDGEHGMIWNNNNKKINNADLPALIPGFQFGDKGVCNPCVALQDNPNYSCPFSLNLDGDDSVSAVWKAFWGV